MTSQVQLQQRIAENEAEKRICSYESVRFALEERIADVFSNASKSQALSSFPASERTGVPSLRPSSAATGPRSSRWRRSRWRQADSSVIG